MELSKGVGGFLAQLCVKIDGKCRILPRQFFPL